MRAKAEKMLEAQAPTLLVGSPRLTAFSTWQIINNKKPDPTSSRQTIKLD